MTDADKFIQDLDNTTIDSTNVMVVIAMELRALRYTLSNEHDLGILDRINDHLSAINTHTDNIHTVLNDNLQSFEDGFTISVAEHAKSISRELSSR